MGKIEDCLTLTQIKKTIASTPAIGRAAVRKDFRKRGILGSKASKLALIKKNSW
jgi:hypothetical protein